MYIEVFLFSQNLFFEKWKLADALFGEVQKAHDILGRFNAGRVAGLEEFRIKKILLILGSFD